VTRRFWWYRSSLTFSIQVTTLPPVEDLDLDVVRSRVASLDCHGREWRLGCAGAVGRSLLGRGLLKTVLG
jgi:hypothetical protein